MTPGSSSLSHARGRLATRVGAIDCGTNSIRLLVADVDDGELRDVERQMEVVRLGQGVDRTGRIDPEALERTLAVTRRYAGILAGCGVPAERVRYVATSASRDAENRDEFVRGVVAALGVEPEVVSGAEEAGLSFRGALRTVSRQFPGPFLVVDLGGGSTELALGTQAPQAAYSMDVGCVRITERHLRHDPPEPGEVAAAEADVRASLAGAAAQVAFARTATLVGLAGSITTLTAHALRLDRYDRSRIDGAVVDADTMLDACTDMLALPRDGRAALPYMHPGRVDVIGAGALVWREVIGRVRADVAAAGGSISRTVTSEHDILDGIALSVLD